jgi:uncharacterized protein with PIN domain
MIATDTSMWIAFLERESGEDTQRLDKALEDRQVNYYSAMSAADVPLDAGDRTACIVRLTKAIQKRDVLLDTRSPVLQDVCCSMMLQT